MTPSLAQRVVMPEWLDQLPPRDPAAVASRRDLQFLNYWMGHARIFRSVLRDCPAPWRVAELGAGDAAFFLRLARHLGPLTRPAHVALIDRQPSVSPVTMENLQRLGWTVEVVAADVFDWLDGETTSDILLANLFLHHFEAGPLQRLFTLAASRARIVAACEPRRCRAALAMGTSVRLFGCNAVTRHDAPISVRAGFTGRELSRLWPDGGWDLAERRAGWFSHFFLARRTSP